MKVLILGGTGMAGHVIATVLAELGHNVTTFSRKPLKGLPHLVGDARDPSSIRRALLGNDFDIVVNAIGVLNYEAEIHHKRAIELNAWLPHYLSESAKEVGSRVIHISTDCVFSGKDGGYSEASFPDSASFYGRTKALGELDNQRDLTFRTSIVGPDLSPNGIGLLNWFLQQRGEVKGYARAIWSGVTTLTLAHAIDTVMTDRVYGLYNLVNNKCLSKFELLCLFNRYLREGSVTINPSDEPVVDKSLLNKRSGSFFYVPTYEEMVVDMAHWVDRHRFLYPHYGKCTSVQGR